MRVEQPRRFLNSRAWSARVTIAIGLLLLVQGVRVFALELLWSRTDRCVVRAVYVGDAPGAHVVELNVQMEHPTCIINIEATPPLATLEEARAKAAAWPVNGTTTCHRVPYLCGAGIERPHVAAVWWVFPIAAAVALTLGLGGRRTAGRDERRPTGGPFRDAAPRPVPAGEPFAIRLPGPGWLARIGALIFVLPLGVLTALPMLVVHLIDPLGTTAFPLLTLAMAALMGTVLFVGVYAWFGRRRLVVDGTRRVAFVSRGIGALDVSRRYATFAGRPTVAIRTREGRGRYGGSYVEGWDVVLSDGQAALVVKLDAEGDARELGRLVEERLEPA